MIGIAKLTTDYISITFTKTIITDGAPSIVQAKFNTPFIWNGPFNQSDVTRYTNYVDKLTQNSCVQVNIIMCDIPTHVTPALAL